MNRSLYYGEIAASISANLCVYNIELSSISAVHPDEGFCTIVADAARIFDQIEEMSESQSVDWPKALNHYSIEIGKSLTEGEVPQLVDMIQMVSRSIEQTRKCPQFRASYH